MIYLNHKVLNFNKDISILKAYSKRRDDKKNKFLKENMMKNKNQIRPQSQYTVNWPEKIRRRILKNLHATAYSRISPERTHRARQIIESLNRVPIVNSIHQLLRYKQMSLPLWLTIGLLKLKNLLSPHYRGLKDYSPHSASVL